VAKGLIHQLGIGFVHRLCIGFEPYALLHRLFGGLCIGFLKACSPIDKACSSVRLWIGD